MVASYGELQWAGLSIECYVVGVDVDEGHATTLGDPIELAFPDVDAGLVEDSEEGEVLREGVGERDIAGATWTWDPEGENGAEAVRLGFEGIGVERGGVVFDVELVQPGEPVLHGGG